MPKTYFCPFFGYEKDGCIICEAGKVKPELRDHYIANYCASMGYRNCTLYRALELQYETRGTRKARARR